MNGVYKKGGKNKEEGPTMQTMANEVKGRKLEPDRLFTKLADIVPLDRQFDFLEWLNNHPRAMESLKKGVIVTGELQGAYQQYLKETGSYAKAKETALALVNPQQLAAMISVPQEKVERLLTIYTPEQLKSIAVLSQRCETDFDIVVKIDEALLNDGSYVERLEETKEVVLAYGAIKNAVNDELKASASLERKRMLDAPLDKLWGELLKKHNGDEEKAAEEYAKVAEAKLKGIEMDSFHEVEIDKELVVEIFKLLNYDPKDLDAFVEYLESNIKVTSPEDVEKAIEKTLKEFVAKNRGEIVLNERSVLYGKVVESVAKETERVEEEAEEEAKPGLPVETDTDSDEEFDIDKDYGEDHETLEETDEEDDD
ncbi:MAG: hypothetical protein QXT45_02775 [Candidatus Bilamarchaeaceae archaeon]